MDRRSLIAGAASAAALAASAKAQDSSDSVGPPAPPSQAPAARPAPPAEAPPTPEVKPSYPASTPAQAYDRSEIVNGVSDFLGVSAESAGSAVEKIFKENGRPTAYVAGEEGSGSFFGGIRMGKGLLYMKGRQPVQVYWQGPSIGFDWGLNASRNFTLCYNLQYPEMIFRRFPGVEGSAYLIAGLGVNYQRADEVTLAPIRTGVGLRLGANVGYLSYSRKRHFPL